MPAFVITEDEHVEINGVPLDTPAWSCDDLSPLYAGPPLRGGDVTVAYLNGVQSRRRFIDGWRFVLPMMFVGHIDPYGVAYPAGYTKGLRDNLAIFKREVYRPRRDTDAGTRLLRWIMDDLVLTAPSKIMSPLNTTGSGNVLNAMLDVFLPGGVLRDEQPLVQVLAGAGDHIVANPGTGDQFASSITFDGGPCTIVNKSWNDAELVYTGTDPVTVNTGNGTHFFDDGTSAAEFVTHAGDENLFPLAVGDNVITIPAGVSVGITHRPVYL